MQINPVLQIPLNSGMILQNVSLVSGSNTINHKLGKKLQGWFIVRQRAAAEVYDLQDSNLYPELTLILNSNASVNVNLFVF